MRARTGLVLLGLFVLLAGVVVFAIGISGDRGALTEKWVSDTARDNRVNHHAVGVGPDNEVIVAPVAEQPGEDVSMTNTSCSLTRLAPENGSVLWQNGVPPAACYTHALTEPAIRDIDGDSSLEVISSTTENALVVLDATTGTEEFRVPLATYGYGRPTVADIHRTPGKEIVTSDIRGNVVLATANGSVLWRTSLNRSFDGNVAVWKAPIVDDMDADGDPEVVIGSSRGPAIISHTGQIERTAASGATYLATGQADSDPAREIAALHIQTVRLFDSASHERQRSIPLGEKGRVRAFTDTDGDGTGELFLGLTNGTVMAVDARTGATEWKTTVITGDTRVLSPPVLADVDGNDDPEVVAVSRSGTVTVLDATSGDELAAYERQVPIYTFPTPSDVDADSDDELLIRYGDGRVVALDYTT